MEYLLLIIGFVLLVKGADFFVDGASSVAAKLKVPSLIIGLTFVSMGTSLPEAAVSISASLNGSNEISLGNVIGSNIFNLLVVVGISSLILPIMTDKEILKRDMPIAILITGVLCILLIDGRLSRIDAGILLLLFADEGEGLLLGGHRLDKAHEAGLALHELVRRLLGDGEIVLVRHRDTSSPTKNGSAYCTAIILSCKKLICPDRNAC